MPRKDDEKAPETVPVKVERDLHRMLKTLASSRGEQLYDLVDGALRPWAKKEWEKEFGRTNGGKHPPKPDA